MKTIYIDSDFRCYPGNQTGTYTAVETDAFDGKCDAYIEGYRFVTAGKTWTRSDGAAFTGEMVAPWRPWAELDAAQRGYEQGQLSGSTEQLAELDAAYREGVDSL